MGRLEGKIAAITGGVSGIGLGTVELFVEEGARVAVGDIQDDVGKALEARFPGKVKYVHTDVTSDEAIGALVSGAVDAFGRLDVMFNNAGAPGDQSPILELGEAGLNRTNALLLNSVMFGHKHAARQFIKQGSGGAIISTASAAALEGGWSFAAYTTTKHAVIGIVRQAAAELGPHNIRSNAICPGVIMTPIMANAFGVPPEDASEFEAFLSERIGKLVPAGRAGFPRDIAEAALFLASDGSAYVNGVALPVDGGATAIVTGPFAEVMVQSGADFNKAKGR